MPPEQDGLERELARIVGAEQCLRGEAAAGWTVDGAAPWLAVRPGSQDEVAAILLACAQAGAAVVPWGGGSAMALGNPPARLDVVLRLDRLSRIVEFDAANLNVTAEAGVRLGDLQRALGEGREVLPLDPARVGQRTVGGLIATNASGPRRLLYGTARDWVLGMRVALASGERIRCGGKVIKNVSGYDMNKLFIGSLGTLGVITEATFKLLPAAARQATVGGVFPELSPAAAVVTRSLESFLLPEALEILNPAALEAAATPLALQGAAGYGLAIALAGSRETVDRQVREFAQYLTEAKTARIVVLNGERCSAAWEAIRDAPDRAAAATANALLVKIAVPIRAAAMLFGLAESLGRRLQWPLTASAHAGSGVIRAAYAAGGTAPEAVRDALETLRREAEAAEGSLVVEAAPTSLKRHLEAWGKPGDAFAVMRRLKTEFDPRGILSPGRYLGGI